MNGITKDIQDKYKGYSVIPMDSIKFLGILRTKTCPLSSETVILDKVKDTDILVSNGVKVVYLQKNNNTTLKKMDTDNLKTKPLSHRLMVIFRSYEPLKIRAFSESVKEVDIARNPQKKKQDDYGIDNVYLPSLLLIDKDKREFFGSNSIGERIKVTMKMEILDQKSFPVFKLPLGYHGDCYECPHAYNKSLDMGDEDIIDHFDSSGQSFTFKCDVNLCEGVKEKYKGIIHAVKVSTASEENA